MIYLKVLRLAVRKEYFEQIKAGIKKEEYREIKDYWIKRLSKHYDQVMMVFISKRLIIRNLEHLM